MEPVEPQVRDDHLAVVAVDAQPRGDVGILPDRRPAARAVVAIRRAELPYRAAEVERPGVVERGVRVRVERALLGKPGGRPVLPPVEIPLEALIQLARVAVEETRPRAPRQLIGPTQIPQVVGLETGRAALEVRLKEHSPAHLTELPRFVVPPQRRAWRVESQCVRALVIVRRLLLRLSDGPRAAGYAAPVDRAR